MKNLRLLSLIMLANLFWYTAANAQDVLTPNKPSIRTNTDVVFKSKSISRDSFVVADVDNELSGKKLNVYNAAKFRKIPAYSAIRIISAVFGDNRLRGLIRERAMIINYYVTKKGAIEELTFTFKEGTTVNADELAKLQFIILTNLQTKISFDIPAKATKGEDLFILRDEVVYRDVLGRTAL